MSAELGHNIRIRRLAQDRGWKLSEYGLFAGERLLAGKTEQAVYRRLQLPWIPPELREDRGEVEAAQDGTLPSLVELGDIRGDLQCHTVASDGKNSIREMAEAARELGYGYLAITDHSKRVTMAGGLDDEQTLRHADAIREVGATLGGFRLLAGMEVDVLRDGELDLAPKTLESLDWVIAAVHYDLQLDRASMTDRLVAAVRSGLIHAIAHPTGRIIGRREGLLFDADAVLEACAEHGVCLEINAAPDRLDLPDHLCKRAKEAGVRFTISTDAHSVAGLGFMKYGLHVARRGWLEKGDVLNTKATKAFESAIRR
ncbi:MAG: PHP domain-containing protein [Myxococcota bacterium]